MDSVSGDASHILDLESGSSVFYNCFLRRDFVRDLRVGLTLRRVFLDLIG